ncbi:hypothetical protein HDV00_003993, partial [Rhizophlyctis rosea]
GGGGGKKKENGGSSASTTTGSIFASFSGGSAGNGGWSRPFVPPAVDSSIKGVKGQAVPLNSREFGMAVSTVTRSVWATWVGRVGVVAVVVGWVLLWVVVLWMWSEVRRLRVLSDGEEERVRRVVEGVLVGVRGGGGVP